MSNFSIADFSLGFITGVGLMCMLSIWLGDKLRKHETRT